MKWSATVPASWSLSFEIKSFPFSRGLQFIRRARHHLFCNFIPTLLILICVSWAALLFTEQIYQAETSPKLPFDKLYADH